MEEILNNQENMEVYAGRPESVEGRMEKEIAVYDLLDKLEIPYQRVDHEVLMTVEECNGIDKLLGIEICKNLFLCNSQKTKFYMLMMPGKKKFDTKVVSKQIGSARLSFAKPEFMEEFLNITPGSVSVMGLMNDIKGKVQLLVDKELLESEFLGCHPCINTSSLKIKTKDIFEKFLPYVKHDALVVEL